MPEIDVYSLKTRYGELILAESEEQVCLATGVTGNKAIG